MLIKGLIDNRCHALEAVPVRRAIHKLNAIFSFRKLRVTVNILPSNMLKKTSDAKCKKVKIKISF